MTRVAVVGAGIMGANHARVLRRLPEAELTLVVDPDEQRLGEQRLDERDEVRRAADAPVVEPPRAHLRQHERVGGDGHALDERLAARRRLAATCRRTAPSQPGAPPGAPVAPVTRDTSSVLCVSRSRR